MRVAVIGIGSNSVRMLESEAGNGVFTRLGRDRAATRLFAGLDAAGNLSPDSMASTVAAAATMAERARDNGAEVLRIFATSASRDARNGADFLKRLKNETGIDAEIISGEEEAVLSYIGAADVVSGAGRRGVIDIGGGSTELVFGRDTSVEMAVSCQMGAVRLFRECPIEKAADIDRVIAMAGEILRNKLAEVPAREAPGTWVGTGGTFTSLASLHRDVSWEDRRHLHGTGLTREGVRAIGERLAGMSLAERMTLKGLQPARADIVVHGIAILLAVMEHFGAESLTVSEYGNLDGYVKKHFCG